MEHRQDLGPWRSLLALARKVPETRPDTEYGSWKWRLNNACVHELLREV